MKTTFALLTICLLSLCSNAQSNKALDTNINKVENLKTPITSSPKTIKFYRVKEITNSNFGGSVMTYSVSDISLISTTDLGPNNKRIVTTNDGEIVEIPSSKKESNKSPLTPSFTNNQVAIKNSIASKTKIVAVNNFIDKKQIITNNVGKTAISKETENQKSNDSALTILNTNFDKKGNSYVDKKENLIAKTTPIITNKVLKNNLDFATTPKKVNNIASKYTPNQLENYNSSSRIYDVAVNEELSKTNDIDKNKNLEVSENFILVNILNTYEKVAEKGYKSIDLFKKLGNQFYFDGEYKKAAKWYGELFTMTTNLDSKYYYHFAHSLKEIGNVTKSNEIMLKLNRYNKSIATN
ncbi:MAG: hypothetical protein ABI426_01740 [Flavobacterium sp.]